MCSAPWYSNTRRRSRMREIRTGSRGRSRCAAALDDPEQERRAELVLDEVREPDGDDEEQADRQRSAKTTVAVHRRAGDPLLLLGHLRVGGRSPSALKPITSDSPSATTPRTIGHAEPAVALRARTRAGASRRRSRRAADPPCRSRCAVCVELRRPRACGTATAHVPAPRIITPSRTAWPPTGASRVATHSPGSALTDATAPLSDPGRRSASGHGMGRSGSGSGRALGGTAAEAVDAAARVDELLLARVERVAVGADLHVDIRLRGTGRELVAAGAAHV